MDALTATDTPATRLQNTRPPAGRRRSSGTRAVGDTGRGDVDHTFDVWDERLASSGTRLAEAREQLVEDLTGPASAAYRHLSGRDSKLAFDYRRSWQGELLDALREGRADDLKHQRTGSGPHRDELVILLDGMPARTHASQGEQRCVALALRLASHELATTRFGEPPTLLLDDVFSELDDNRAALLAECLPLGQVLLATAVDPPSALSGSVVNVLEIGISSEVRATWTDDAETGRHLDGLEAQRTAGEVQEGGQDRGDERVSRTAQPSDGYGAARDTRVTYFPDGPRRW